MQALTPPYQSKNPPISNHLTLFMLRENLTTMESELTCVVMYRMTFSVDEVQLFFDWHVEKHGEPKADDAVSKMKANQNDGVARLLLEESDIAHLHLICPDDHKFKSFLKGVLMCGHDEEIGFGDNPHYDFI